VRALTEKALHDHPGACCCCCCCFLHPPADVLQGVVLFIGSIIFLVVQKTELGGLPAAALFYRNPANAAAPNVSLMQNIPPSSTIVAYWDFVFKVRQGAFAVA
jgi:hypothetical protein